MRISFSKIRRLNYFNFFKIRTNEINKIIETKEKKFGCFTIDWIFRTTWNFSRRNRFLKILMSHKHNYLKNWNNTLLFPDLISVFMQKLIWNGNEFAFVDEDRILCFNIFRVYKRFSLRLMIKSSPYGYFVYSRRQKYSCTLYFPHLLLMFHNPVFSVKWYLLKSICVQNLAIK